jgi:hypothetical protein
MDPLAHASVALMARRTAPKAHLLGLVAATQVPDLLFFALEAAGVEHQAVTRTDFRQGLTYLSPARIPWSHGLATCIGWSAVAGSLAAWAYRDRRAGAVVGSLVFSHWALDALVYDNLPLRPNCSREVGLGLITTRAGFVAGLLLEAALVTGGVAALVCRRKN